ncbi:MAG: rhodanese-like domain-containing protein [Flavisolibacter sp.]
MKLLFAFLLSLSITTGFSQQFKADNVKYKTVYPEDLCNTLKANPDYVILDVRSDGEFHDTSSMAESLNIGHLKNAMHIDIRQLPARWKELNAYKDRPLFVYCSHSQRSRRASRLLADSGFTRIYNINGGLTNFYAQGIESDPCSSYTIETTVPYKIISSKQLSSRLASGKPYYIIDIRTDSVFNGLSASEKARIQGKFTSAVNLPFEKWNSNNSFVVPDKPVLLIDDDGDDSPKAAKMLMARGVKDVSVLFGGMDEWSSFAVNEGKQSYWTRKLNYEVISGDALNDMIKSGKKLTLIDIRSSAEFNNQSKNYWQNIGQIKNAVNIPFSELKQGNQLPSKSEPIVLYGFNNEDLLYDAAAWMASQGYQHVSVLEGGIWHLRWAAHNIKGKSALSELVMNVPAENQ